MESWLVFLGVGIYGATISTYLIAKKEYRMYGIIGYILTLLEVVYYYQMIMPFYILSVAVTFLVSLGILYPILSKSLSDESAEEYSIFISFIVANIVVFLIGLNTWIGISSISISLIGVALTILALQEVVD